MNLEAFFADRQNIIVVAVGLGFLILIWLFFLRRKHKKNRRFALKELNAIRERYAENLDNKRFIYETNLLLRRISVNNFSRQHVESLTGDEWLQFLDSTGNTYEFSQGAAKVLAHGSYHFEKGELDTGALYKIIKSWIKIQT